LSKHLKISLGLSQPSALVELPESSDPGCYPVAPELSED
jgi:hypothetical protein